METFSIALSVPQINGKRRPAVCLMKLKISFSIPLQLKYKFFVRFNRKRHKYLVTSIKRACDDRDSKNFQLV